MGLKNEASTKVPKTNYFCFIGNDSMMHTRFLLICTAIATVTFNISDLCGMCAGAK